MQAVRLRLQRYQQQPLACLGSRSCSSATSLAASLTHSLLRLNEGGGVHGLLLFWHPPPPLLSRLPNSFSTGHSITAPSDGQLTHAFLYVFVSLFLEKFPRWTHPRLSPNFSFVFWLYYFNFFWLFPYCPSGQSASLCPKVAHCYILNIGKKNYELKKKIYVSIKEIKLSDGLSWLLHSISLLYIVVL